MSDAAPPGGASLVSTNLHKVARYGLPVLLVVSTAAFLWAVRDILMPFIFSLALAHFANPAVELLELRGVRRDFAIALLYVLLSLAVVSAGLVLARNILEASEFIPQIPQYIVSLTPRLAAKKLGQFEAGRYAADYLSSHREGLMASAAGLFPSVAAAVAQVLALAFIIPFISFFVMMSGPALVRRAFDCCPSNQVERLLHLMWALDESIGNYLRGIIVEAGAVALLTFIGLKIVGLKFAFWLALLSGVSNLIPYMGPVVGGAAGIIIAIAQFDTLGPVAQVVAVFAAVQFIDNWILQPVILKKAVDIHPVLVLFALGCGGQIAGATGLFFAVPAACVIRLLLEVGFEWYRTEFRIRPAARSASAT